MGNRLMDNRSELEVRNGHGSSFGGCGNKGTNGYSHGSGYGDNSYGSAGYGDASYVNADYGGQNYSQSSVSSKDVGVEENASMVM